MSPKSKEQFEQIRVDRKAAIMDAALHVFAEEGYHSASISKVSKLAGVSKGLMYNYFDSKQDLLKQLLHSIMHKQQVFVDHLIEKGFTDDTVIELIDHTIKLLKDDPKHWKLYFLMAIQPDVFELIMEDNKDKMQTYMQMFFGYFQEKFPDNATAMMHYFSATFSGIRMTYILSPESFPLDDMRDLLINQFVKK